MQDGTCALLNTIFQRYYQGGLLKIIFEDKGDETLHMTVNLKMVIMRERRLTRNALKRGPPELLGASLEGFFQDQGTQRR